MGEKVDEKIRIQALAKIYEGKSLRAIASELGVSKSVVGQWKKESEQSINASLNKNKVVKEVANLQQAKVKAQDIKVSDRYSEYVDTLRTSKDRQGKWAGAVTETGIRALKFANKFLAKVEKQEKLTKGDMELIKLIPTLLSSSAAAIKSAGEAEDRAYSLELIATKLDELPHQIKANNRASNPRTVVAND
jgi:hypothetical protein